MPYLVGSILRANEAFAPMEGFDPHALLDALSEMSTMLEGVEHLGLLDSLELEEDRQAVRDFLGTMPPSLDAAIMAGVRSALARGVRVQFTWQPGYDFELRAWERSDVRPGRSVNAGVVNFHIVSPEPPEAQR